MGWQRIQVNAEGANGSAGGSGAVLIDGGLLTKIHVSAGVPITGDIVLKEQLPDGTAITLLTLSNISTPYTEVPQTQSVKEDGSDSGSYTFHDVGGQLHAVVSQANAGVVNIWVKIL